MPDWIQTGFHEYVKRMPHEYRINLIEVPAEKRSKHSNIQQLLIREGEQMLKAIPPNQRIIALTVTGKAWNTEQLAKQMQNWREDGRDISLLIGGPEGLAPTCLEKAEAEWSLSPLTFPHMLVRIIVSEQLYRAWSILANHPYHRA